LSQNEAVTLRTRSAEQASKSLPSVEQKELVDQFAQPVLFRLCRLWFFHKLDRTS